MTYALKQMQDTIHYIVAQCRDDTERGLSGSQKRWLEKEITLALDPLQKKNKKLIVVHPSNLALQNFFWSLTEQKISFPSDTTYLIYRRGDSYEKQNGERKEIYNRIKIKSKNASRRISELQEQLESMQLANEDTYYSSDGENDLSTVSMYTPARQITLSINKTGIHLQLTPDSEARKESDRRFTF
ncbi:hypothetical protein CC99x_010500 [Candidatus Berkiella cookevillensis]|uniref:Uncharacterized protein n=1 Tax=Candidatus Berkiella cookevillensis TaxID=437022 RepID=A0A0Q9YSS6_9GAMM|nr:hypothetical protein [Candidatus Berkiella cookevillensis]MCS5709335.1 hypothetical protein [Candidatus Berkiella cookevillensis]